jgi:Ca-activated chloride channel family protein
LHAAVPRGASDVAGAIAEAAGRLDQKGKGQVVYLGDGAASAGELGVDSMAARIRPVLSDKRAELRLFGAGPSVDEMALEGLAESLSASYERLATGESLSRRAAAVAKTLSMPLLSIRSLALPAGFSDVYPKNLPAVRIGEELVLVGRIAGATGAQDQIVKLSGTVDGEPVEISRPLAFRASVDSDQKMLSRRWATARIAELGRDSTEAAAKEIVALSQKHHVQSRLTSLLVLENDRMFAEFGIPRTQGNGKLSAEAETARTRGFAGDSVGDSFGASGLGLSGVGEGGGGIGKGMGTGVGEGFGSGHGRLSGEHKTSVPRVRMGATTVSGRLPPEVIQRIVRQNFGRFRLCYENGLRKNPDLQGRVAVRFVITREGSVGSAGNAGSDMPDSNVVNCVVRAFQGLAFPQPEGGIVTVIYPISFSPEGGGGRSSVRPLRWSGGFSTESWVGKADEGWRKEGGDAIARLMKDLESSPESRRAREALISGLLSRGRFEDALREATQYVVLDPDRVRAHELVAQAAAALGDEEAALHSLESEIEIDPRNAEAHRRAARAFEASGDERRACAHFRALSELRPHDEDALFDSLRCKARVLGERDASLAKAAALKDKSKKIAKLHDALAKGESPAYTFAEPGGDRISVKIDCGSGVEGCPRVLLLDPQGRVSTPTLPGNGRSGASWVSSWASSGNYRVLVTGGLPGTRGDVTVRLDETTRKFEVQGGPGARSVALVAVTF